MVSMTIINKVIYAYLHHTHVTKAHFGTGAERLSITIFLPLNHTIMLKCLELLTFYLENSNCHYKDF